MLTPEEVRTVPLFASLSDADLDRLVRTSADILLRPGEYAVHEGGERALYAVLSGKVEVVKLFDGVERTLGWRLPGAIFGEVPLAFATPFPGGYRAAEASRVMRMEPQHYYAIAASAPEVAEKVGALARERIGGLQGIAMQPPKAQVTVFGERWDPACSELRRFLSRNQIVHDWVSPETKDLARAWAGDIPEASECPTVRLPDGTRLARPTLRELAVRLGLQTRPQHAEYDTLIIGGGPAGLAAAVYGASEGLRTLVIEREAPGGQAGTSSRIENYLGFPNGVSGDVARDKNGYVLTGDEVTKAGRWSHTRDPFLLECSVPGVFACGDVRLGPIKRVAAAVGEGSMAIAFVHQYMVRDGLVRR